MFRSANNKNTGMKMKWGAPAVVLFLLSAQHVLSCPSTICVCEPNHEGNMIINCRNKGLTQVPQWTPENREYAELSLGRNRIRNLNDGAFAGLRIQKLDLTDNDISGIHANAFRDLDQYLNELKLHVTGIQTVPKPALEKLPSLQKLELHNFQGTSFEANTFTELRSLHTLKLVDCSLSFLQQGDFAGLGQSLEALSLQGSDLNTIPTQALAELKNLETLNITDNSISTIQQAAFSGLQNLQRLDLTGNGINTLFKDAFQGLENSLEHLNLRSNNLKDNQMDFITGLKMLRTLDLAYNKLTFIPNAVQQNSPLLYSLDLQSNEIKKMQRSDLIHLRNSLQFFNLAGNMIESIDDGAFNGMQVIKELVLDRQPLINVLRENTLQGLEVSLTTLSLQNCGLSVSQLPYITHLPGLKRLHLGENMLSNIPNDAFNKLNSLQVLDLHQNAIKNVNHKTFTGLRNNLESVDLSVNSIKTLPDCTFHKFDKLRDIHLSNNPLKCDCQMVWLHKWVHSHYSAPERQTLGWFCEEPESLKDQSFAELSQNDLRCDVTVPEPNCDALIKPIEPLPPGVLTPENADRFEIYDISDITRTSFVIKWRTPTYQSTTGFNIDLTPFGGGGQMYRRHVGKYIRSYEATNLEPGTKYIVKVTRLVSNTSNDKPESFIEEVSTLVTSPSPVTQGPGTLKIVLGVVFGVVGVILIIIVVVLVRRYRRQKYDDDENPYAKPGDFSRKKSSPVNNKNLPQISESSQRFSRNKSASQITLQSVDSFSPEERDRILNMLTNSGGTMISVLSGTSTMTPELPPRPANLPKDPVYRISSNSQGDAHLYNEVR